MCLLDLKKCFDTIDHEKLVQKLEKYGVKQIELACFKSYLSGRKQRVKCGGQVSSFKDITISVPQGSIIGPLLFLLYVNDIGQHVFSGLCNLLADDTLIYTSAKLQFTARSKRSIHMADW